MFGRILARRILVIGFSEFKKMAFNGEIVHCSSALCCSSFVGPFKELAGIHNSFTGAKPRGGTEQYLLCASEGNIGKTKFFLDATALPIL